MVDIYTVATREDNEVLHIWIRADEIPPVPFIVEQLTSQEITQLARQIVANHKVRISYVVDDIPALLQHLEETYNYTLSQIRDIILWCGDHITQSTCLELLKKARV